MIVEQWKGLSLIKNFNLKNAVSYLMIIACMGMHSCRI